MLVPGKVGEHMGQDAGMETGEGEGEAMGTEVVGTNEGMEEEGMDEEGEGHTSLGEESSIPYHQGTSSENLVDSRVGHRHGRQCFAYYHRTC